MNGEVRRKTGDELLREIESDENNGQSGRLKIVLGYASGVGKSLRIFEEGRRRCERGQDLVVGATQEHVSPEVRTALQRLEAIPLKPVGTGRAVDVEALIRRHPAVCIIDGLAFDNPPESPNRTRWEDVQDLLNAGINVIASLNIQYIRDLRDQVEAITGKVISQTVPVSFVETADEIEIVDAISEESIGRSPEESSGISNRQHRLSQLRELALVLAADVVDHQLLRYLKRHGISQDAGTHERILVCITPRANIGEMLESARIVAERFHGELIAAYVKQPDISPSDAGLLQGKLEAAREAGAKIAILDGKDPVEEILRFAKDARITQLFVGHSQRSGLQTRLRGNPVDRLIQRSRGMDVRVFPQ